MKSLHGANLERAKGLNRRVALDAVLLHGPISRLEIAKLTGLTPQTVSNIIGELHPVGLITETERRTGKKGQPAREYCINESGVSTIGLHIDQQQITAVLVNLLGEIRHQVSTSFQDSSPENLLNLSAQCVDELLENGAIARDKILGVGLAMPGIFKGGKFVSEGQLSMAGWKDYPAARNFADRLNLPVFVENDATAAALGNNLFGAGKNMHSFVFIYFGAGLGGGIVINGSMYSGAHVSAGEIGHLIVEPGGRICPCGNNGCLERYVSLYSAYQSISTLSLDERVGDLSIQRLEKAFEDNDPGLLAWTIDAASHLRSAINILENLIDPEAIILGGQIPSPLLDSIMDNLYPLMPSVARDAAKFENGKEDAAVILMGDPATSSPDVGAAALPMTYLLHPPEDIKSDQNYTINTDANDLYLILWGI